jgi:hypothetical protein
LDVFFLDHAVFVRQAERVEKGRHHRALFGQVIHDEGARGEGLGQVHDAREMPRLAIDIQSDDGLGTKFLLLGNEHHGLNLFVGRLLVEPERLRGRHGCAGSWSSTGGLCQRGVSHWLIFYRAFSMPEEDTSPDRCHGRGF